MKIPKATVADYIEIQGGKPKISQGEGGIWHIKHEYMDGEPEIRTHIPPAQRGTVNFRMKDGIEREFEIACLWRFEGQPCEVRSLQEGGHLYERKG